MSFRFVFFLILQRHDIHAVNKLFINTDEVSSSFAHVRC